MHVRVCIARFTAAIYGLRYAATAVTVAWRACAVVEDNGVELSSGTGALLNSCWRRPPEETSMREGITRLGVFSFSVALSVSPSLSSSLCFFLVLHCPLCEPAEIVSRGRRSAGGRAIAGVATLVFKATRSAFSCASVPRAAGIPVDEICRPGGRRRGVGVRRAQGEEKRARRVDGRRHIGG